MKENDDGRHTIQNDHMIVVLTGGIASGKTQVSDQFGALGVPIIDTDLLAREVVLPGTPGLNKVVNSFGTSVLKEDGTLDRTMLRNIVFRNEQKRRTLETILHPEIRKLTIQQLKELGTPKTRYSIVVIPLLAESGVPTYTDRVLLVSTPIEKRRSWLMARDGLSSEDADRMIRAQATAEERESIADDLIVNDGTLVDLREKVANQHDFYLKMAADRALVNPEHDSERKREDN